MTEPRSPSPPSPAQMRQADLDEIPDPFVIRTLSPVRNGQQGREHSGGARSASNSSDLRDSHDESPHKGLVPRREKSGRPTWSQPYQGWSLSSPVIRQGSETRSRLRTSAASHVGGGTGRYTLRRVDDREDVRMWLDSDVAAPIGTEGKCVGSATRLARTAIRRGTAGEIGGPRRTSQSDCGRQLSGCRVRQDPPVGGKA